LETGNPDDFHKLIGRAMDDTAFRGMLLDPDQRSQALRQVGIENPTKEQLSAIASALDAIGRAADTFGVMKAAM